ncbi:MAG: aminoacyl-tRNA hydrolase [Actinomycetota bacterium]
MHIFRRSRAESDGRLVVAGLGNPGERYAGTRHNAGAMVIDELLRRTGSKLKSHRSSCLIAEVVLAQRKVTLARTTSYMNESGRPLGQLMRFYKVEPSDLVVVHDEIDLPFGRVRLKFGGGTAGHNGLRSVVSHLGTKDFVRVRLGVGRPRGNKEAVGHVLDGFSAAERKELPFLIAEGADAVERIAEVEIERAMNEINTRAD